MLPWITMNKPINAYLNSCARNAVCEVVNPIQGDRASLCALAKCIPWDTIVKLGMANFFPGGGRHPEQASYARGRCEDRWQRSRSVAAQVASFGARSVGNSRNSMILFRLHHEKRAAIETGFGTGSVYCGAHMTTPSPFQPRVTTC